MGITNSFRSAVGAGEVRGIRIMMKDSLLVDPTFAEFKEMESLARNVSGLYDAHDGRKFETDPSFWNDDYMNKLMVQVVGNFSHERLSHLKDVVRHLRPIAAPSQTAPARDGGRSRRESSPRSSQPPLTSYQKQKRQDERNKRIIHDRRTKIAVGAAAGAVTGGLVGGVAFGASSVAVCAVAGAVVVGVVVIATNGG